MENILIVESENDKYFVEAIINHLNLKNIAVEGWTICISSYECMGGIGNLKATLNIINNKIIKDEIKKVGIILDLDNHTIEHRLNQINKSISSVFNPQPEISLDSTHKFITLNADEDNTFELACYFINLNGIGELDHILKEIANKESHHANCLDSFKTCLQNKNVNFKEKDLRKEWIRFYIRYDTCEGRERNQAERKCNLEAALQKSIWNFEHECLQDLKDFLILFNV